MQYYNIYTEILEQRDSNDVKYQLIFLFKTIIDQTCTAAQIKCTTLFSKITYLQDAHNFDGKLIQCCHTLRIAIEKEGQSVSQELLEFTIPFLIKAVTQTSIPKSINTQIQAYQDIRKNSLSADTTYFPELKFTVLEVDASKKQLIGFSLHHFTEKQIVQLGVESENIFFAEHLKQLKAPQLPLDVQFIDVRINQQGFLVPDQTILQPDYLVDVTSVANCFDTFETNEIGYFINKFFAITPSPSLLLGNIANHFLDKIVGNSNVTWDEVLLELFSIDPIGWSLMDNKQAKETFEKSKIQFDHIKHSVLKEFPKHHIDLQNCYLEPTFFSAIYGLQGRLDLLDMQRNAVKIIELKSGSIYKPNQYGLNNNHYVQTLMYDLLIRSTFPRSKPKNYILYSKNKPQQLHLAPRLKVKQKEAMSVRNAIIQIEHQLQDVECLQTLIHALGHNLKSNNRFVQEKIEAFTDCYHQLDAIERAYFLQFITFISKEHYQSKIGSSQRDSNNGIAGMWLDSLDQKIEQYRIIYQLKIIDNQADTLNPLIRLARSASINELSNFRKGDIAILYPQRDDQSCLNNQLFKCTIIDINERDVLVRLRSTQQNLALFEETIYWNLEPDVMDSNFNKSYQQLFMWASSLKNKRDLLLGRKPPIQNNCRTFEKNDFLTDNQNNLIRSMIRAEDYYLVWGPPGTGKTSQVLKYYVKHQIEHTQDTLYVLAYTNKAVDAICQAIHDLGPAFEAMYVRIGSKYSSDDAYSDKLLNEQIATLQKREAILQRLKGFRIVVGTISSILGKSQIRTLLPYHQLIVDEASQIIEPNIIGLMSQFRKTILIGDHHQLPAVVSQTNEESRVDRTELSTLGLNNCRNSLFERLYRRCQDQGWDNAYGLLFEQGRMHEDIVQFSSDTFYQGKLRCLEHIPRLYRTPTFGSGPLTRTRIKFLPVQTLESDRFSKKSDAEVHCILEILKELKKYDRHSSVGIITTFRAQIAALKKAIEPIYPDYERFIMIDTVERFQGSAKDIIIISFCANNILQLNQVISLTEDNIDRKLNVAITRAKEQLLLVGNPAILTKSPIHGALIDFCKKYNHENA